MPKVLKFQAFNWWREPPLSHRYFQALSNEDLLLSRQHPYCAWQGVNVGRANREIRKRKAKGLL